MNLLSSPAVPSAQRPRLDAARASRDEGALLAEYAAFERANPRRLVEGARDAAERAEVRLWLEAWDAVWHEWVLADDGPLDGVLWIVLPDEAGRFGARHATLMAYWLAEADSARVGEGALPTDLAARSFEDQARALARFCLRNDGRADVDYAALHDALDERLRPFLAHWALVVHGLSPAPSRAPGVRAARRRVAADFARCHEHASPRLAPDPLYEQVRSRAIYRSADPRDFVSVVCDRVLDPAPEGGARAAAGEADARGDGCAALLSCFSEHHAVRRSTEPLLAAGRDAGEWRGYHVGADVATARAELGDDWARATVVATDARRAEGARALGDRIAADRPDFLFFPEVGLSTASGALALRRLARVQATTYGHPQTSGSRAMDYFVSGLAFEDGTARYRERLVLLPGLGVASNAPPAVEGTRARPVDAADVRFASLSSPDKLHPSLFAAWRAVLDGRDAELVHYAGARGGAARALETDVRRVVGEHARYRLHEWTPRERLLTELREADLLLDSFPFTGFNTLVDALVVGVPVVSLRTPGLAGAIGAAVLERLGVADECVADSVEEWIAKVGRLADDPARRAALRGRLSRDRVLPVVCDPAIGEHFRAAVAWMREQGPNRGGAPVLIEAGERPRVLDDWPRR